MTLIPYQGHLTGRLWKDLLDNAGTVTAIRANVKDAKDAYLVEAELPGVKKEDITLICEKGVLTISAKAGSAEDDAEGRYIRKERAQGELGRRFALEDIDEEHISAKLENGILYVTLPKTGPKEKHIDIE
jgi:HSP20 family protein